MEPSLVSFILVFMEGLPPDLEDILWVYTRKDVAFFAAVVSPLVGICLLVARIRPVSQELRPTCNYVVAGRA
jgi:hypothetical protein